MENFNLQRQLQRVQRLQISAVEVQRNNLQKM